MKCFWLKDVIRDRKSLLLIVQYIFFGSESEYIVFRICMRTAEKHLTGYIGYSFSIIFLLILLPVLFYSVCFDFGHLCKTFFKKASNSLRDCRWISALNGKCWTDRRCLTSFWSSWNHSTISLAVCVQTSLSWNMGKWCKKMASYSSAVINPYNRSIGPNRLLWEPCRQLIRSSYSSPFLRALGFVVLTPTVSLCGSAEYLLCDAHTAQYWLTLCHRQVERLIKICGQFWHCISSNFIIFPVTVNVCLSLWLHLLAPFIY